MEIGGFRRLRHLDIEFRPFMVIVGANGVGKTSFLDVLRLLSASASGNLGSTLSQMGGISSILTRGKCNELRFKLDINVSDQYPLEYELQIVPQGTGYAIAGEALRQNRGKPQPFKYIDSSFSNIKYFDVDDGRLIHPTWEHNSLETSLAQVPKMFREPETFRRFLAGAALYHTLDVSPRAPVRMPQPMKPALTPGIQGEDLLSCLYSLRENYRSRFDVVIETLRVAFPALEELNFPPVAAGTITLTWKDRQFNQPIYLHELSEGILRFLWLVTILQVPDLLPTIIMIDEPEVSLHPELLSLLADLMREASERVQLIVATHSDRFIRFLRPEEVLVMDIDEEGCATAVWADTLDLEQWLREYSLDEVWRMGRMGGRA